MADPKKSDSELAIYDALVTDQCWFGFEHTARQLMLWISHCDREARKLLIEKLAKADKELDGFGR
jgi:hypothetical protein